MDKKKIAKPNSVLNLEREISKKAFLTASRPVQPKNARDPITQTGISDFESNHPTESKPRGPARGEFSAKGQGSLNFNLQDIDTEPRVSQTKRAECIPVNRNPITQDHASLNPIMSCQNRDKYAKVRDSTLFGNASEPIFKPRSNQYYDKMQSKIFENHTGAEQIVKPQLKQVSTKSTEIGSMLCYNNGGRAENITIKPTNNRINQAALNQKKELSDHAKVYNARRNQSAITFN